MSEISECVEEFELDDLTTTVFSKWTSDTLFQTFKNRYQDLTNLSIDFFNICFRGITPNEISIYIANEKMRESLLGYDEWSQFIPTGNVGLHHKFKTNAGVLSHILKQINLYEQQKDLKKKLNEKIRSTTGYRNLQQMLHYGMLLAFFLFVFLFVFSCATIFFVCFFKQVKMLNI